ncbi:hypothetical protein M0805_003887 [Coniferiporia weirii]|nr:hypothetical protein M0805_003887 [Coniferiporia weirii]
MASLDGQHPLTLKVMRVSRPSLAAHWQPFFSSSPSFSQHATLSALSLQGAEPLQGHPKTLRDLTHAGQMLMLPAAFGAIQLGETFACVLSVNNEAGVPVDAVHAKVEMQTITSKVPLAEVHALAGGEAHTLLAGDSLEMVVSSEIKELGQHVLACTVTYRTPPGMRPATSGAENADDPFVQTFRKFYKFAVTNPLSVKTKVHVPRSPTALLSRNERDKVFLEVHVQNLTQGPLCFEKVRLEAVEGWDVVDVNAEGQSTSALPTGTNGIKSSLIESMPLVPAQDTRQFIYIMIPKVVPSVTSVPVPPAPGTVIPLGRLDISWRSAMGEPGRLLTSVLSRRIPLPAPPSASVAPVSALPSYLQKSALPGSPRPRSPSQASLQQQAQQQQQQQRVATPPPQRPGSPLKRATTPAPPARPQSPGAAPPVPSLPSQPPPRADVEVDLVLLEGPTDATVWVEKPFTLRFSLAVSATLPHGSSDLLEHRTLRKARVIRLVVQHTFPRPPVPASASRPISGPIATHTLKKRTSTTMSFDTIASTPGARSPQSRTGSIDVLTPRRVMSPPPGSAEGQGPATSGSGSVAMSPSSMVARGVGLSNVGVSGLEERLRRVALSEALGLQDEGGSDGEAFGDRDGLEGSGGVRLPPPYSASLEQNGAEAGRGIGRVSFAGMSAAFLPPISLTAPQADASVVAVQPERGEGNAEFLLSYMPRARGFARVGGLRVLLVEDREKVLEDEEGAEDEDEATLYTHGDVQPSEARILGEWGVVAEVWVR